MSEPAHSQLHVIVDTTVFADDQLFKRRAVFYHFLRNNGHRLVVPAVVLDEMRGGIRRDAHDEIQKIGSALGRLEASGIALPEGEPEASWSERVRRGVEGWEGRLRRNTPNILAEIPYDVQDMPRAVLRAATRRRPVDNKGEQVRDALVWEASLRYIAGLSANDRVAFISSDATYFDAARKGFHEDLLEDLQGRHVELFSSPHGFLVANGVEKGLSRLSPGLLVRLSSGEARLTGAVMPRLTFRFAGQDVELAGGVGELRDMPQQSREGKLDLSVRKRGDPRLARGPAVIRGQQFQVYYTGELSIDCRPNEPPPIHPTPPTLLTSLIEVMGLFELRAMMAGYMEDPWVGPTTEPVFDISVEGTGIVAASFFTHHAPSIGQVYILKEAVYTIGG